MQRDFEHILWGFSFDDDIEDRHLLFKYCTFALYSNFVPMKDILIR